MTLSFLFWLCMFLWLLGNIGVIAKPDAPWARYGLWGSTVLLFILFFLVGLKLFGFPIQGG